MLLSMQLNFMIMTSWCIYIFILVRCNYYLCFLVFNSVPGCNLKGVSGFCACTSIEATSSFITKSQICRPKGESTE